MKSIQGKTFERSKHSKNIEAITRKIEKLDRELDNTDPRTPSYRSKVIEHSRLVAKRSQMLRRFPR
jgi:hypothetical protein